MFGGSSGPLTRPQQEVHLKVYLFSREMGGTDKPGEAAAVRTWLMAVFFFFSVVVLLMFSGFTFRPLSPSRNIILLRLSLFSFILKLWAAIALPFVRVPCFS